MSSSSLVSKVNTPFMNRELAPRRGGGRTEATMLESRLDLPVDARAVLEEEEALLERARAALDRARRDAPPGAPSSCRR